VLAGSAVRLVVGTLGTTGPPFSRHVLAGRERSRDPGAPFRRRQTPLRAAAYRRIHSRRVLHGTTVATTSRRPARAGRAGPSPR